MRILIARTSIHGNTPTNKYIIQREFIRMRLQTFVDFILNAYYFEVRAASVM